MNTNMNYALIETTIRNTLKKIKDDPERSVRNLIDMALSFSDGRFQKQFFRSGQKMLEDPNSSYYKLIPDVVANVDCERIVSFCMNIGYNSCTLGARKIRETESTEHFNIPWSILLEFSGKEYKKNADPYHSLISQGIELGIYTWSIFSIDYPTYILELASAFPECAFVLFCSPDDITPALLDDAASIYNVMFIPEYLDSTPEACALLRSRNFLYSVYRKQPPLDNTALHDMLCDAENCHAVFTILLSQQVSLENSVMYESLLQIRAEQKYRSVPFDMLHDNYMIDNIISEEACPIFFAQDGSCYKLGTQVLHSEYNFFHLSLREILKQMAPKNAP